MSIQTAITDQANQTKPCALDVTLCTITVIAGILYRLYPLYPLFPPRCNVQNANITPAFSWTLPAGNSGRGFLL